ncbi:MAG: lipid kinase [Deltaproteobacteria bacterium]|nr:lipid kinase [Deltaproteobacteria bacterium]
MLKKIAVIVLVMLSYVCFYNSAAVPADKFSIAWSHYTGWEPWELARHRGILEKWSRKYNIEIRLELVDDYRESINSYTRGTHHGCVMTNMDALTIPAMGGVDSTALIIGDFSNGNDGIVMKNGSKVMDLKNRKVKLVERSVSHYLLARALEKNGLTEGDLTLVNTPDADIAAVFASDPDGAVVTWNPLLMQCRNTRGAKLVFDSRSIPGEIIDLMIVRTDTPDSLKKALVGAWYETMFIMSGKRKSAREAIGYMADFAGGTEAEFRAQLRTTAMFYKPADAVAFANSNQLKETMEYVRTFCFTHTLYGDADSKDFIGIQFPDKTVMGDKANIKLRFDSKFMQMAADGQL